MLKAAAAALSGVCEEAGASGGMSSRAGCVSCVRKASAAAGGDGGLASELSAAVSTAAGAGEGAVGGSPAAPPYTGGGAD
jgi:hypothetical protein